jgi:acetyl esterase/lipase
VDYRLTDVAPYPAQIDDVQYAVRWVRANAAKYHIDPARLGSLGGSAGGYLATMLGVRDSRDTSLGLSQYSSQVQVVINRSGALMDATNPATFPDPKGPYAKIMEEIAKGLSGGKPVTPELLAEVSPITYVNKSSSPLLAVHSVNDELVPLINAQSIVAALKSQGIEARLETVKGIGSGHGRKKLSNKEQEQLWNIEKGFLRTHLSLTTLPPKPTNSPQMVGVTPPVPQPPKGWVKAATKAVIIVALIGFVLFLTRKKQV